MFNLNLLLDTALLLLIAYLLGCVLGYTARRVALRLKRPQPAPALAKAAPLPTAPQLVVAPVIAPLPVKRELQAEVEPSAGAAAELPVVEPGPEAPPEPIESPYRPAHVAGQTMSRIDAVASEPVAADLPAADPAAEPPPQPAPPADIPDVLPEPPEGPVRAEDVPDIDEKLLREDAPVRAEDVPPIDELAHVVPLDDDPESAAMRAIEGGWTPRHAKARPERPEGVAELTPVTEVVEANEAMAAARRALAAANAAAERVLADQPEPAKKAAEG